MSIITTDPAVVRMSQTLALMLNAENQPPVHFYAYFVIPNLYVLLLIIVYFSVFGFLASRSWGVNLLLKYPSFFTHGLASKMGPSKEVIESTRFVQEYYAKGGVFFIV